MALDYRRYIVQDLHIYGGGSVVRATRVTVRTVLVSLAEGLRLRRSSKTFLPSTRTAFGQ